MDTGNRDIVLSSNRVDTIRTNDAIDSSIQNIHEDNIDISRVQETQQKKWPRNDRMFRNSRIGEHLQ